MIQHATIQLGSHVIGPGAPPFVIAEAGVNHDGRVDHALRLVDAAKAAGASAVKFQVFRADKLVAALTPLCDYQKLATETGSQREMLQRLELSFDDFRRIRAHADREGIMFLATPFGVDELRFLVDELRVEAVKLASPDIINVPLLAATCRCERPIVLSTGASDAPEIDRAAELIRGAGALDRLILLHCVSAYPTDVESSRLGAIATLSRRYGVLAGFSDHTPDAATGAMAVFAGACVLEKHLTLDRRALGPDHFFSLEPEEMRHYIEEARRASRIIGDGALGHAPEEAEVRKLARGRILAARVIVAGEAIGASALMVCRSASGLSAAAWDEVIGCIARRPIAAGVPIEADMLIPRRSAVTRLPAPSVR